VYYPPVSLPGVAPLALARFQDGEDRLCPMGLLPSALAGCPYDEYDFMDHKAIPEEEIKAFAEFWDSLPLDKAEKVAREIWPDFGSV